jgi:hypothetical protein
MMITEHQEGVITTAQALAFGMSPGDIRWKVQSGRWQSVYRGVYATFSGKLSREARLWAAVLRGGDGAALSHETAAERHDFAPGPSSMIHVTVPAASDPARWSDLSGVVVHRSVHWRGYSREMLHLPVTPVTTTVLDLVDSAETLDEAYGWLSRAITRRVTVPALLAPALAERKKFTRRKWLTDALTDIGGGAASSLERRWAYDVERPHGLPRATRQSRREGADGLRSLDNRYEPWDVSVELGFKEVANHPCAQAGQLARALIEHGWDARKLKPCKRPGCSVGQPVAQGILPGALGGGQAAGDEGALGDGIARPSAAAGRSAVQPGRQAVQAGEAVAVGALGEVEERFHVFQRGGQAKRYPDRAAARQPEDAQVVVDRRHVGLKE